MLDLPENDKRLETESSKPLSTQEKLDIVNAYFAKMAARHQKRMESETPLNREKRMNRERKPPHTSAPVYVWEVSEDDPRKFIRILVRKADREETLDDFSDAQRRYNSFDNEWDCCAELGPPNNKWYCCAELNSDDEDNLEEPVDSAALNHRRRHHPLSMWMASPVPQRLEEWKRQNILAPTSANINQEPKRGLDTRIDQRSDEVFKLRTDISLGLAKPVRQMKDVDADDCPLYTREEEVAFAEGDLLEVLANHWGCLEPERPHPSTARPIVNKVEDLQIPLRFFGESMADNAEWLAGSEVISSAKDYMNALRQPNLTGPPAQCDLSVPVAMTQQYFNRLQNIRIMLEGEKQWYMFDFGEAATVPWHLAVPTAALAMTICRWHKSWTDLDIATSFLKFGMPFRTLLPVDRLHRSNKNTGPRHVVLPQRHTDHKYSRADYNGYAMQRDEFMQHPRARAAPLRGNVLWRLTMPAISIDRVLNGPTCLVEADELVFVVKDMETKEEFYDNDLSETELDFLCGTYDIIQPPSK